MAVFTAAALIGAAASGAFAAAGAGITIFGATFTGIQAGLIVGGASLALSAASSLLAPKPKALAASTALSTPATTQLRQPITSRKIIYGAARVSGPITFAATSSGSTSATFPVNLSGGTWSTTTRTATKNELLHIILPLASHECARIDTVYLNDVPIHPDMLDANGFVTSGTYSGKVRIKKHLGTDDQLADSDLLAENPTLGSEFRGRGVAYLYLRYEYNADIFSAGIPNAAAYTYGKPLYDPRDGGTRWSPDSCLCWRDYMTETFGLSAEPDEIDDVSVSTGAEDCQSLRDTKDLDVVASSVDATRNWLVMAGDVLQFEIGDVVRVSSNGSLPGGIAGATDYYVIPVHYTDSPALQLATSYANALAFTAIDITSAGSGTITVTKTMEPRYTCNGVIDLDNTPSDILGGILSSMGGRAVYIGGKWKILPAVWRAPTILFDENDLTGEVVTQTRHSRRDLFNALQGSYISNANLNQPTNYPAVTNATWEAQDGYRIFNQLDLPMTNRAQTAQRLAKIELERHRRQISCDAPFNVAGLLVGAGDNLAFSFANNGWDAKSFELVTWVLTQSGGGESTPPALGANMSMREVDEACFEFDETTEEVQPNPAPATNLPDPFSVSAPINLVLETGTDALFRKNDGTIVSRILASWDSAPDSLVDRYETQYKLSADANWNPSRFVSANVETDTFWEVMDGESYDVRVRAANVLGKFSSWLVGSTTVIGKTTPPSNVGSLTVTQNGQFCNISFPLVLDADVAGVIIKYMAAPFIWDRANLVTEKTRGTKITNGFIPPGTWVVGVKAVDNSGNESLEATLTSITVTNPNDIIFNYPQGPDWERGTRVNGIPHYVSGSLVPEDQDSAAGDNFDVFDTYVQNPYTFMSYEAEEIDVGFDAMQMRVYADLQGGLGIGQTGIVDLPLELDYRLSAGSYDGFEDWTIGLVDARYLKFKTTMTFSNGLGYISSFTPVADAEERTERGFEVIPMGGGHIGFAQPFSTIPNLRADAVGNTALIVTRYNYSTTGFDCRVLTEAGVDVGGTVDWQAIGV